jgi:hypothetical protein
MITKRAADLRQERILTYHLTHPEMTEANLHPSRRMLQNLLFGRDF